MLMIPYARGAAVAYARRWALSRNPVWYDFENLGGDCTNFVSQCLFAASGIMNFTPETGWYFRSLADRAAAWTGVEFLHRFLVNNRSVGPFGREVERSQAQPGDIVQLGDETEHFYHSPIILTTRPIILVAAHSYDALDRPLETYSYARARFIHIDGVRVG